MLRHASAKKVKGGAGCAAPKRSGLFQRTHHGLVRHGSLRRGKLGIRD